MPSFQVIAASKKKEVDGQHGPMQVIALTLQGQDGQNVNAEWFTKASTPLPSQGETINGTVEHSNYGLKFKKEQQQGGGRGGGGRSPEENRRIVRQHSQEMALRYANAKAAAGQLSEDFWETKNLRALIDWFDRDAWNNTTNAGATA